MKKFLDSLDKKINKSVFEIMEYLFRGVFKNGRQVMSRGWKISKIVTKDDFSTNSLYLLLRPFYWGRISIGKSLGYQDRFVGLNVILKGKEGGKVIYEIYELYQESAFYEDEK